MTTQRYYFGYFFYFTYRVKREVVQQHHEQSIGPSTVL